MLSNMRIPLCHKCSNKIVQPDLIDPSYTYICGCKLLTAKQWEDGMKKHQTNCPHIEKMNEDNSPTRVAEKAIDKLLLDLSDRAGLGNCYDCIDDEIKAELRATWTKIIEEFIEDAFKYKPIPS